MRPPVIALVALAVVFTCALLLVPGTLAPAADRPKEPLVKRVEQAIEQGKQYLLKHQTRQGDWERDAVANARPGGCTALALLALLNAGVLADHPAIQRGLAYLREVKPRDTYVVGLQTMVYCLAGEDKQRIENNVKWLLDVRRREGAKL